MPKKNEKEIKKKPDRKFNSVLSNLSSTISDLSSSIYGGNDDKVLNDLDNQFQDILKTEIQTLRGSGSKSDEDMSSFISKLYEKDRRDERIRELLDSTVSNFDMTSNSITGFLTDAYQNKLIYQSDIYDISSQLIELDEAVNTMRDAIVTADIVSGRINREIHFKTQTENKENNVSIVEAVEKKFGLQEKIKNFIVKKSLTYGEFYVYIIPYSKIFTDFLKNKDKLMKMGRYTFESAGDFDAVRKSMRGDKTNDYVNLGCDDPKDLNVFIESCKKNISYDPEVHKGFHTEMEFRKELSEDIKHIMERVTVIGADIPLPIFEEGVSSIQEFSDLFVSESGERFEEKTGKNSNDDVFVRHMKGSYGNSKNRMDSGMFSDSGKEKKENKIIKDMKDCYVKMIEPTRIIELKIMDEVIGYLYVKSDEASPLHGVLSSELYKNPFNQSENEKNLIGDIASRIVEKLDNKFLKDNPKFKKLIAECINYYGLSNNSIKIQFIPKEYMVSFKIDRDMNGNGVSMLHGSLFYAKLYLILLLFKMMSIILYSNDTRINYVKQSGIDKDIVGKVQEIMLQKQARTINITDFFDYTNLINKIGNGFDTYIPVGKGDGHVLETEVLSGQDVQINNELMELLRNSYILGTGVPAAIMNYLNEADFAKSIEVANTKFNGRVINYQLDFNEPITEMYQKILKFSTNMDEDVINMLEVSLIPPKTGQNNVKAEAISNFTTLKEFLVPLYFGESPEESDLPNIREFTLALAKDRLTMLDFDEIDKKYENSIIKGQEKSLLPKQEPSDDELLNGI